MASYKQILKLIHEGKSASELLAAIGGHPSEVRRALTSPRLVAHLELERTVAVRLGKHRLAASLDHLIGRRLEIADDENPEVARKAAEALSEHHCPSTQPKLTAKEVQQEMQREQKVKFLYELYQGGGLDYKMITMNHETRKWGFEEAIESGKNREQQSQKA